MVQVAEVVSCTIAVLCLVFAGLRAQSGGSADEIAKQETDQQNFLIPLVPVCQEDEFLTSNGTALICRKLPDVGFCDCPGINVPQEPDNTTDGGEVVAPLPPTGCPVFSPPIRGAHVCLRNTDLIYCSVLCDHRFEFSSTPHNPYFCGEETNFLWTDFAEEFVFTELPECTGFRHRLRMLHPYEFYLPAPCYGLSNHTIVAILMEFQLTLEHKGCTDCAIEDTFLLCPSVEGSVRLYTDITARDDYYSKK